MLGGSHSPPRGAQRGLAREWGVLMMSWTSAHLTPSLELQLHSYAGRHPGPLPREPQQVSRYTCHVQCLTQDVRAVL